MKRRLRWLESRTFLNCALGATSIIAFTSLRRQVVGLYGRNGLVPVEKRLKRFSALYGENRAKTLVPSLLWFGASDRALLRLCRIGQLAATLQTLGFAPRLFSALTYLIYGSFVSAGGDFLAYQWDVLLLETTFLHALAGARRPTRLDIALYRLLLFRLHLESGICKLESQDPTWRDGTALSYHYWTQPIPTPLAWRAHQLSRRVQRASTRATLAIELALPWLVFGPRRLRIAAWTGMNALHATIAATGNYGFFNLLSSALTLPLLDDGPRAPLSIARAVPLCALAALSLDDLFTRFSLDYVPTRKLPGFSRLASLARRTYAVGSYGLFAVMTTRRPEIIIEASRDGSEWREIAFRYKAGDQKRAPPWVAPHQPRLDWQMWFAALGAPSPWLGELLSAILEGRREVLSLLDPSSPFSRERPRFVRARLFEYEMTSILERAASGAIWKRRLVGVLVRATALSPAKNYAA